jgi:hypothetical protein
MNRLCKGCLAGKFNRPAPPEGTCLYSRRSKTTSFQTIFSKSLGYFRKQLGLTALNLRLNLISGFEIKKPVSQNIQQRLCVQKLQKVQNNNYFSNEQGRLPGLERAARLAAHQN